MRLKLLEYAVLRRLACAADCDEKTIQRCYRKLQLGEEPRGMPSHRARQALIAAGLVAPGLSSGAR